MLKVPAVLGCGSRTFPRAAMASDVSDVAIAVCQKHRAGEFIQEFFLGFDAALFAFAGAGGLSASETLAGAVGIVCCSADARVRGAEACFGSSGGVAQAVLGSRDRQNRPEEPKVQTSGAAAAAVPDRGSSESHGESFAQLAVKEDGGSELKEHESPENLRKVGCPS